MTHYPQRKSPRMPGYDYGQEGVYFVTICTVQRVQLFGEVVNGEMFLNDIGKIAHQDIIDIPHHYPHVEIDCFVVMPNHVHILIVFTNHVKSAPNKALFKGGSLGAVIIGYKSGVTRKGRRQGLLNEDPLWQGRYYDNIIRDEQMYNLVRRYVHENPLRWSEDRFFKE